MKAIKILVKAVVAIVAIALVVLVKLELHGLDALSVKQLRLDVVRFLDADVFNHDLRGCICIELAAHGVKSAAGFGFLGQEMIQVVVNLRQSRGKHRAHQQCRKQQHYY